MDHPVPVAAYVTAVVSLSGYARYANARQCF
jgi:hypothetical protein